MIQFKQSSVHDVIHLDSLELNKFNINFIISCRTQKQKGLFAIGLATFNLSSFEITKYLTCNQELAIMLDCDAPIILGTLKISAQLGCGKLYFGKEFVGIIQNLYNVFKNFVGSIGNFVIIKDRIQIVQSILPQNFSLVETC